MNDAKRITRYTVQADRDDLWCRDVDVQELEATVATLRAQLEAKDEQELDAILQSVLQMIGLPSFDERWFDEHGDWDFGKLREYGLNAKVAEIRAALAAVRAGGVSPTCPICFAPDLVTFTEGEPGHENHELMCQACETVFEAVRAGGVSDNQIVVGRTTVPAEGTQIGTLPSSLAGQAAGSFVIDNFIEGRAGGVPPTKKWSRSE